jgi:hypothetical protein
MVWVVVGAVLGGLALVALGYLGLRVFREVKTLMKQVGQAGERLNSAAAPLQRALEETQDVLAAQGEAAAGSR